MPEPTFASVTLSTETWALVAGALDVMAEMATPERAEKLRAAADALVVGVKDSLTRRMNGVENQDRAVLESFIRLGSESKGSYALAVELERQDPHADEQTDCGGWEDH